MRKQLGTIIALVFALAVAGCAGSFKSDVSRFHQLPRPSGETFVILPKDKGKQGSLEFAQYAGQIANRLAAYGYQPAAQGAQADLLVFIDYGIDDSRTAIRSYSSGFYGGYWSHYYSPWGWGPPGFYDRDIRSYEIYVRRLEMAIEQNGGQRLFEGRVISEGRDNRLPEIMPYMIEAMFTDFPGQSGGTQYVKIPMDGAGY